MLTRRRRFLCELHTVAREVPLNDPKYPACRGFRPAIKLDLPVLHVRDGVPPALDLLVSRHVPAELAAVVVSQMVVLHCIYLQIHPKLPVTLDGDVHVECPHLVVVFADIRAERLGRGPDSFVLQLGLELVLNAFVG